MAGMVEDHGPGVAAQQLLRISVDDDGGCLVVHVSGEVEFTTAGELRDRAIAAALAAARPRLVLDLAGVSFCDSSGLSVLVGIWKAVHAQGGQLALAQVPERCRIILTRTGLASFMEMHDTTAQAVAAVCAQR
jgi:anti-sigma B factor antagonist